MAQFELSQSFQPGKHTYVLTYDERYSQDAVLPVTIIQGKQEGPLLLVLAGVHGDEYDGIQTVIHLSRQLQPEAIQGTLVMIPVANVNAYTHISRTAQIDGANLA